MNIEKDIRKVMSDQLSFLHRELGRCDDCHWIVSISWSDKISGSGWSINSKKYECVVKQHQMIDFNTMRLEFYEIHDV